MDAAEYEKESCIREYYNTLCVYINLFGWQIQEKLCNVLENLAIVLSICSSGSESSTGDEMGHLPKRF